MPVFARFVAILTLSGFCLFGGDTHPKGVHPRATPDDYAVKANSDAATYAVSLIPTEQAKHLFAFDITGKYLVFEIACFPKDTRSLPIDPDDFLIRRGGELTHVSDASAVALAIQMENSPKVSSRNSNTDVRTEAHVGYESGVDPYSGRRVNGVYGGGGAAVEHGGPDQRPPDNPRPGGTPDDRKILETQLQDRQLPVGKFDNAVAGYIYFLKAAAKKDGSGNYVIQHLGETNASGRSEKVEIVIPAKTR